MTGATTHREPEFDRHQVALLLSHRRQRADIGSHGIPMSEATAPEASASVWGGWHYEANVRPRVDNAQLALEMAQAAYYKEHPDISDAQRRSHQWYVHRVDDD